MPIVHNLKTLSNATWRILARNVAAKPRVIIAPRNNFQQLGFKPIGSMEKVIRYYSDCCPPCSSSDDCPKPVCPKPKNRIVCYEEVLNLKRAAGIYLIDVRDEREIAKTGKIPLSMHIPACDVTKALKMTKTCFREKYGRAKPKKDADLIFYSNSGKRAKRAMNAAIGECFDNARMYKGGWKDWAQWRKCRCK